MMHDNSDKGSKHAVITADTLAKARIRTYMSNSSLSVRKHNHVQFSVTSVSSVCINIGHLLSTMFLIGSQDNSATVLMILQK